MLAPVAIQYCSDVGVVKSNSLSVVLECEEIRECLKRGSVVEDKEGTCIYCRYNNAIHFRGYTYNVPTYTTYNVHVHI